MMLRIVAVCIAAALVGGCSSIKPYPNTLAKNMRVSVKVDSGSVVKSTSALLDIYSVDAKCQIAHEGRLELEDATTNVGLPTNKPVYLEFIFANSNYLTRNSSSTTYGLVFTPHAGSNYQVKAQYSSGIYDVVVRDSAGRVVEQTQLGNCRARA